MATVVHVDARARGLGFEHGQFEARERARRGSSHAISVSTDTCGLGDQHSFQAYQRACSLVA